MDSDLKFSLLVVAVGAVLCGLIVAVIMWMESIKCENRWARSGLRSDWGVIRGCMVERKDGTWVPASAIRDVSV